MRVQVQPGKRSGSSKVLFDSPLDATQVKVSGDGMVVIEIVASDIYTANASQRFSITLSRAEMARVEAALKIAG